MASSRKFVIFRFRDLALTAKSVRCRACDQERFRKRPRRNGKASPTPRGITVSKSTDRHRRKPPKHPILCPSSLPDMPRSLVLGTVVGTAAEPRLQFFTQPQPVTPELLRMAAPVNPAEVFRFASACARSACKHFHHGDCQLAKRMVQILPAVDRTLPPCGIRSTCRWFRQEGALACSRCRQVPTLTFSPDEKLIRVAAAGYEHTER